MRCVLDARAALGEGPVWCPEEGALYWIDSMAPSLNRFDPATGGRRRWPVPDLIGSFALRRAGGALLALRHGLAVLDFERGAARMVKEFADAERDNRFNDGKCDRRGRFWAGTMHFAGLPRQPRGRLYRFAADLSHAVRETGHPHLERDWLEPGRPYHVLHGYAGVPHPCLRLRHRDGREHAPPGFRRRARGDGVSRRPHRG